MFRRLDDVAVRELIVTLPVKSAVSLKVLNPLKTEVAMFALLKYMLVDVPYEKFAYSIVVPRRYPIVDTPIRD